MPRGPQWRDPDTGRALSFDQFAKKADDVARDLRRALARQYKAGNALIDARTVRQERARSKSLQGALAEVRRQRARQAKIDEQLGPPEGPGIPPSGAWELSIRYTSRSRGSMHIVIRLERQDQAQFTAEDARGVFRQWRRDGTLAPGYAISAINWATAKRVYNYGEEAAVSIQPIVASTPLNQMRIGRPK